MYVKHTDSSYIALSKPGDHTNSFGDYKNILI